ncbi:MAG: methyltransferase [Nanoarchaeota archaeon]|nr:methyltransferase [Nanoarchaeota archaeon]MBU1269850.1 methyltransferase [Nanoarchaeota archaeon]MBU1605159.1 methyltransferase [Nanoarchaeota archaeon]MBU2442973.1 methyltransferase [Nanoarchaeota archaeon]
MFKIFFSLMVYEPAEDSFLLLKQIKNYAKGLVLDVGTGSGILAEEAAKYADIVVAVDVNPEAVAYCTKKYKHIEFRQSDLFSNVPEKFNLIIFNPPYLPTEKKAPDIVLDGGPKGYEIIERFLKFAKNHLKKGGVILLLFSSFSKKEKINKILSSEGYIYKEIAKQHIHFEDLYVYRVTI